MLISWMLWKKYPVSSQTYLPSSHPPIPYLGSSTCLGANNAMVTTGGVSWGSPPPPPRCCIRQVVYMWSTPCGAVEVWRWTRSLAPCQLCLRFLGQPGLSMEQLCLIPHGKTHEINTWKCYTQSVISYIERIRAINSVIE